MCCTVCGRLLKRKFQVFFSCGQRRGKLEAREEVAEVTGAFIQWDTQEGWTLGPYEYYQRLLEGPVG